MNERVYIVRRRSQFVDILKSMNNDDSNNNTNAGRLETIRWCVDSFFNPNLPNVGAESNRKLKVQYASEGGRQPGKEVYVERTRRTDYYKLSGVGIARNVHTSATADTLFNMGRIHSVLGIVNHYVQWEWKFPDTSVFPPLSAIRHGSRNLTDNRNTQDPVSFNNVDIGRAVYIQPDLVQERIRHLYNYNTLRRIFASRQEALSPITRRRITSDNLRRYKNSQ